MIKQHIIDYTGFENLYPERKRYAKREHRADLVSRIMVFIIVAAFFVFVFSLLFFVFLKAPWWTPIPLAALGLCGALWLAFRIDKKYAAVMNNHLQQKLEVIHIRTNRVVKKAGSGETPPGFYIEVNDAGTLKTFFLCNLYIDELQFEGEFPNTEFIIYKEQEDLGHLVFVDMKGRYLEPEKMLMPFTDADFEQGKVPGDCSLMEKTIDELT